MNKILEIKNASVFQGRTQVFDKLSLELSSNHSTAIIGPNGSGKSTLLKLLGREIYPVHSEHSYVRIFSKERWVVSELKTKLGIVSYSLQQNYSADAIGLYVVLSGFYGSDGIWSFQTFSPKQIEMANRVIDDLGLTALKSRNFETMSTGEQRKFLLARALVHNPEVLVLDEPTSGLDLCACFQYLDIIRNLISLGIKLILVTHHIHEIPPEISQVVFLKDGKVIANDSKEKLLTSKNLSDLFQTSVKVVESNGYYQTIPGHS
jgi:iron complex transport system ATP-binding protein